MDGENAVKRMEGKELTVQEKSGEYWHRTAKLAGLPGMPPDTGLFWVVGWHDESWVSRVDGPYVFWLEFSLPKKTQEYLRRTKMS